MKSVSTEERPFLEIEQFKALPNNVAIVCPSSGHRTLPATITYLRPLFLFDGTRKLAKETLWLDWDESLLHLRLGCSLPLGPAKAPKKSPTISNLALDSPVLLSRVFVRLGMRTRR